MKWMDFSILPSYLPTGLLYISPSTFHQQKVRHYHHFQSPTGKDAIYTSRSAAAAVAAAKMSVSNLLRKSIQPLKRKQKNFQIFKQHHLSRVILPKGREGERRRNESEEAQKETFNDFNYLLEEKKTLLVGSSWRVSATHTQNQNPEGEKKQ